ncbi:FGGY family carbohydrate kinase [Flectobacillus roseus]|uniref:ATP:glycerol 3-phosphotransferase n=1 Tax=Flectobacillus roseus TaxID=502259 RepID=A0ABT6YEV0_9BACT|nr:glycerol kinase GlpK [Flectobacillus roseus]MDI9861969.1 glycerol kinase GlpK [Flectobacillus roseus]
MKYILAIDQGTSSTKSIIFDNQGKVVSKGHADLHTNYFDNGFVEQDPEEIFQNVLTSVSLCLEDFQHKGYNPKDIASCGISNQRETFVLWDKTGKALSPAVVWACKRSTQVCENLIHQGQNELIKQHTGLIIDPYFSGTKLLWLLENNPDLKTQLDNREVYFGTVDCWLLYKLTEGKSFKTDHTNAHRTLLLNIHSLTWDKEILALWGLEKLHLPEVYPSSHDYGHWTYSDDKSAVGVLAQSQLPITALIGDSHAATFGEGCFEKGTAKATLGTGCSIMSNIGNEPLISSNGMLTTVCWSVEGRIDYAFEGAIVSCGSTIEWLKNEMKFFTHPSETEDLAQKVKDNAGVYLIPAFSGLGAPHWQMSRKASIQGISFGTNINHIVRAALESIPFQIKDVLDAMSKDMGKDFTSISINGGISHNKFVTTFLADLLGFSIKKQANHDISALGAAYLAGLKSGVYQSLDALSELCKANFTSIEPADNTHVKAYYEGWQKALNG